MCELEVVQESSKDAEVWLRDTFPGHRGQEKVLG